MTVQQLLDVLQCANPDAWVELEAESFWGRVCGGAADPKLLIFARAGAQELSSSPGPNTTIGVATPTTQNANVRTATWQ